MKAAYDHIGACTEGKFRVFACVSCCLFVCIPLAHTDDGMKRSGDIDKVLADSTANAHLLGKVKMALKGICQDDPDPKKAAYMLSLAMSGLLETARCTKNDIRLLFEDYPCEIDSGEIRISLGPAYNMALFNQVFEDISSVSFAPRTLIVTVRFDKADRCDGVVVTSTLITVSQTKSPQPGDGEPSPSGNGEPPNDSRAAPRHPPEVPPPAKSGSAPQQLPRK